jgi:nicotinamidase-related amidase
MTELLSAARSQLLVVDVQERLAPAMAEANATLARVALLAQTSSALDIPITISEQYPKGLGPTVASVLEACGSSAAIFSKMHFSCARDAGLAERLGGLGRRQIVVCGVEAHVCVLQTAIDLQKQGYETFVAADAIASRRPESKELALRRLASAGVDVVTTEMVAFEWLEHAGAEQFKTISRLLK